MAGLTQKEVTIHSLLIGALLLFVLTGANTYFGLYAGMTVSASIPAAVLGVICFRLLRRRGTALEVNLVQTQASAGEAVAAGIIFTLPAMILTGAWTHFEYWPTTFVGLLGGLLGVLVMIPFRRALIVEAKEAKYPEGTATAAVVEASTTEGSTTWKLVAQGLGLGVAWKFLVGGLKLFTGELATAFSAGRAVFGFGTETSLALLGVGAIVGLNVGVLMFVGGAIAWFIAIPIYTVYHTVAGENLVEVAGNVWDTQIRYLGVGAMVVAGIATIVSLIPTITKAIRMALTGVGGQASTERTERDMDSRMFFRLLGVTAVGVLVFFIILIGFNVQTFVVWTVALVAAVLFVVVSSYLVGLVGSSNNPISGMTISTVLLISTVLVVLGITGKPGVAIALLVAGVVCCAAGVAGDISQDLKAGYLLKATPVNQQWAEILGVALAAPIMAPILSVLHQAYTIGKGLKAPQAKMFAAIVDGVFTGGQIPWTMVLIGVGIGIVFVAVDRTLKAKKAAWHASPMAVAVGIYLPFAMSIPIFFGSLVAWLAQRQLAGTAKEAGEQRGTLFAAGLIAGESLMGIALAVCIVAKITFVEKGLGLGWLTILAFLGVAVMIFRKITKNA